MNEYRFLVLRDGAWHPTGNTQIAATPQEALSGLGPAGGTKWIGLCVTDGTYTELAVASRTETEISVLNK